MKTVVHQPLNINQFPNRYCSNRSFECWLTDEWADYSIRHQRSVRWHSATDERHADWTEDDGRAGEIDSWGTGKTT